MMRLRKLRNGMPLKGKRVLIRIDANVPVKSGKVIDGPHGRIARSAVDLDWLSQRGAKVIVLTHLGRPNGRRISSFSVSPIVKRLSGLLGTPVKHTRAIVGTHAAKAVSTLKEGEILVLENVRFDPREEQNNTAFAKQLAELADVYVNDAFSVSHRAHASVDAIACELPSYAGPLLANEVATLTRLEDHVKQPFILLMGGMKGETKLAIMERFISRVSRIVLGGALATAFLVAKNLAVGRSLYDGESLSIVKKLLHKAESQLLLPQDVFVASSLRKDAKLQVKSVYDIQPRDHIVDMGPKTIDAALLEIAKAKTILWNGPFGYCELAHCCEGTKKMAKAIAERTGAATTIVGGGDTLAVLEALHIADQFSLLSTGGGALLEFLAGKSLPGLEALNMKRRYDQ